MISRKSIWQALKRNDLTGQAGTHGRPAFAQGFVAAGCTQTLSSSFISFLTIIAFAQILIIIGVKKNK
jgi:hypothetical protein